MLSRYPVLVILGVLLLTRALLPIRFICRSVANHTRAPSGPQLPRSHLLVVDLVNQSSNLFNFDSDITTILEDDLRLSEESNTGGSASQENGAGFQGGALGKVADLLFNVEDHVPSQFC